MITKDFILAGNATFTIQSPDGKHRTYKIEKVEPNDRFPAASYFVKTLTGPNNEQDYSYLGKLDTFTGQVATTSKSHSWRNTTRLILLNRVLARVWGNDHAAYENHGYKVFHSGCCGRCGRKLTTPDSVSCGIGPECRKHLGLVIAKAMANSYVTDEQDDFGKGVYEESATTPVQQKDVVYYSERQIPFFSMAPI